MTDTYNCNLKEEKADAWLLDIEGEGEHWIPKSQGVLTEVDDVVERYEYKVLLTPFIIKQKFL